MPKWAAVGALSLVVISGGCADDVTPATEGEEVTERPSSTTTARPTSSVEAMSRQEPFDISAEVVGATDTQADHWAQSEVALERFQVRVIGTEFVTVPGFPVTMNGCNTRQLRVEWRSLSDPIPAGYTSFLDPGMAVDLHEEAAPAVRGDMVLNGCEQPVFASTSDGLILDLVVEVVEFDPAVDAGES